MKQVRMFKMPFATNHFNENQRVWVLSETGQFAILVAGKYRGKGRYVSAWVRWKNSSRTPPQILTIEVDEAFAERLSLY